MMHKPAVLRDRTLALFESALNKAYDINDVLAAFWCYATVFAVFELRAAGVEPFVVTAAGVNASDDAGGFHALSAIDRALAANL